MANIAAIVTNKYLRICITKPHNRWDQARRAWQDLAFILRRIPMLPIAKRSNMASYCKQRSTWGNQKMSAIQAINHWMLRRYPSKATTPRISQEVEGFGERNMSHITPIKCPISDDGNDSTVRKSIYIRILVFIVLYGSKSKIEIFLNLSLIVWTARKVWLVTRARIQIIVVIFHFWERQLYSRSKYVLSSSTR